MQSPQKGTLVLWNDDKGFGFVKPENGEKDFFVHISAIKNYHKGQSRRPEQGDIVLYDEARTSGRQRRITAGVIEALDATSAQPTPAPLPSIGLMHAILIKLVAFIPIILSLHVLWRHSNPIPLAAYVFMTPLTIFYYAEDKRRALQHQWRISNFYMHCFEVLGGWPGALLAQNEYRHKLKRGIYQYGFWAIVAAHGIAWAIYVYFQFRSG